MLGKVLAQSEAPKLRTGIVSLNLMKLSLRDPRCMLRKHKMLTKAAGTVALLPC